MRAALVARHGMDFVNDDGFGVAQDFPAPLAREEQIERLRRGHKDMGRPANHPLPLPGRRIPRAHQGADLRTIGPLLLNQAENLGQRLLQVALNVVGQGSQRRDIDNVGLLLQFSRKRQTHETVEAG